MSLITRCPQCGTHFKIVPDQLKISDGWARCGTCSNVFDAIENAAEDFTSSAPIPAQNDTKPQLATQAPLPSSTAHSSPSDAEDSRYALTSPVQPLPTDQALTSDFSFINSLDNNFTASTFHPVDTKNRTADFFRNRRDTEPAAESIEDFAQSLHARAHSKAPSNANSTSADDLQRLIDQLKPKSSVAVNPPPSTRSAADKERLEAPTVPAALWAKGKGQTTGSAASDFSLDSGNSFADYPDSSSYDNLLDSKMPTDSQLHDSVLEHFAPPAQRQQVYAPAIEDPEEATPEFIRTAKRAARWRHPLVRFLLLILALILLLALAVQMVFKNRHFLATWQPRLQGPLVQACTYLGCKVEAWRSIDSVLIDASGFAKVRASQYRITVALRNTSAYAVATPSILLTLTDEDGQPTLRRVFKPAELNLSTSSLAAGTEASGSALVELQDPILANNMAGYKMLAFYP